MDQDFRIDEAYGFMVSGRPSKILSGWTYESKPKPLRSSRKAGEFLETEVQETEDEGINGSPDFQEFSKLLLNGQTIADKTERTYMFIWRGYKACVSSQLAKLTSHELKRRFNLAMESIEKAKKKAENEVIGFTT